MKRLIKDKILIKYPSNEGKQKDIQNIKDFIEKDNHILFTKSEYDIRLQPYFPTLTFNLTLHKITCQLFPDVFSTKTLSTKIFINT